MYNAILERICVANGIKQGPTTEVGVFETMLQLASLGMGIVLISKRIAEQFNISDYVELPQEYRYVEKFWVTRSGYALSPLEKQFIETSRF